MTSRLPRKRVTIIVGTLALAAIGSAVAVASSRTHASGASSPEFTVGRGTLVSPQLISSRAQSALSASGATGQLYLLGKQGDHAYYRDAQSDGNACYAVGSGTDITSVACLYSDQEMPAALIDMSTVVVRRSDAPNLHLESVEGIAADQVSAVGVERADGSIVTTPVSGNAYRFEPGAIPSDAVAIVALDETGKVLQTKEVG